MTGGVFRVSMDVMEMPRRTDDAALLESLASDLDGAFETLVRCHTDRLYAVALRTLGDPADAEEVAQDALVRAYRALASYEASRIRGLHLRAWLATIVVNLARNRRRRHERSPSGDADQRARPRRTARPRPLERLAAGRDDSPEDRAAASAERDRWAALLGDLPERYRVPLVLRHVDDLSYAEMAEALGKPEGTLKAQVHRGLVLLRAAWDAAEREEAIA